VWFAVCGDTNGSGHDFAYQCAQKIDGTASPWMDQQNYLSES
jgi:hypothetical protein